MEREVVIADQEEQSSEEDDLLRSGLERQRLHVLFFFS